MRNKHGEEGWGESVAVAAAEAEAGTWALPSVEQKLRKCFESQTSSGEPLLMH